MRRVLLVAAAVVAVAALALAGYTAIQLGRVVTSVSSAPLRDVELIPPFVPIARSAEQQSGLAGALARGERVNILLLGYGGVGHEGAYLTDSLMLASIDSRGGSATLVSIPRDLWVTFPANKYSASYQGRINEAFSLGASQNDRDEGMRIANQTLEPVLGVKIDRTIAVDFRAFRTVVDLIGGVQVEVERSFTSIYPKNDNPYIDADWIEVSFEAGPQRMDGETALRFARARYRDGIEGSDFARSARQQKVILAARDQAMASGSVDRLLGLLDALRENVRTDLSLADIAALGDIARGYDDARTVKGALTNQNVLVSYGLPVSDGIASTLQPRLLGWIGVRAYVRRLVEFPESVHEDPAVIVRAQSAARGQAAVDLLTMAGVRATYVRKPEPDQATTIVAGPAPATGAFLSSVFGGSSWPAGGQLIVDLGTDWSPPRPFTPG